MVHTYPLVFVMSSFVHTFLCADVLAYIIYLYKMSRLKGVEESLQLSPTDILHRQRMWRRSTPTTATIGVARREEALGWPSHGEYLAAMVIIQHHPTTTGESIKCVIPCNSHILPQSPARAPGRVAYDDEAPALVLVRYWIRYNSINWKKHVPENLQRKSPEYVKEFQSSSQMPFVMRMPLGIAHVTAGFGPAAAHAKSQWPLLWGCMGWGWWCWCDCAEDRHMNQTSENESRRWFQAKKCPPSSL